MRKLYLAAVLFLLALPRAGWADLPMVTARGIVRQVDTALAGATQAAKDPRTGVDPRNPKYAPFWSALQALQDRVGRIEGSLSPRTGEFFLLVDQGSTDLGELRVAWARTGVKNARIAEEIRSASSAYRGLRAYFGREGVRQRQGGPLNAAERQQFQRLRQAEARLAERLRFPRDQARRRGDAATAAELERFRAEAERIAQASADLSSYLNALIAAGEMRGEWHANAPYIRKTAPAAEWAAADETVQDLYADADIGQVFTVDLGAMPPDGVAEVEAPTGGGGVQAYQDSGEMVVLEPIVTSVDEVSEPESDPEDTEDEPAVEILDDEDGPAEEEGVIVERVEAIEPEAGSKAPPANPASPANPPKAEAKPEPVKPPIPPPIG
ncbi:MAG TPA: hypothetical protein VLB76_18070 [Thermoanaerobaculia bacterium]|jgi:hypothetical protein|nr:hypothetical protein [Thermoanaerobaculia bacterium]